MKKLFALVLAILMVLSIAACGAKTEAPAAKTEIKTITPGVLTVAISPDFAPMEFVDPTKDGQDMFVGFDVTLSKHIAENLGLGQDKFADVYGDLEGTWRVNIPYSAYNG